MREICKIKKDDGITQEDNICFGPSKFLILTKNVSIDFDH